MVLKPYLYFGVSERSVIIKKYNKEIPARPVSPWCDLWDVRPTVVIIIVLVVVLLEGGSVSAGGRELLSLVEVAAVSPGEGRGSVGEEREEEDQLVTLTHLVINWAESGKWSTQQYSAVLTTRWKLDQQHHQLTIPPTTGEYLIITIQ